MSQELLIEYRNVNIDRKDLNVLQNVDFELRKGEFVYFIGKVGSGKSSLLKTFYADVPIEEGNAKVFDYDMTSIRKRDIPQLRRKIGIVFQDFQLLNDRSVNDNLEFVLRATGWKSKKEIDEQIEFVLSTVGMAKKGYKNQKNSSKLLQDLSCRKERILCLLFQLHQWKKWIFPQQKKLRL